MKSSWIVFKQEHNSRHDLARESHDGFEFRDIGWIEQMRVLLRDYGRVSGARVLDPFGGLGTTLLACAELGFDGYATEIEASRVEAARSRLRRAGVDASKFLHGSALDLPFEDGFFQLILTSVPYFGAGEASHENWSAGGDQLYLESDYAKYCEMLAKVASECHRVLAPGGVVVMCAQNTRVKGQWVPLAWDLYRALSGPFRMHEERVILYEDVEREKSSDPFATNRSHEYVLIGEK